MPFTYAAFKATETDPKAEIFPLTEYNMLPVMVLWLALTLDIGGQYTDPAPGSTHPGIDQAKFQALALGMGLTTNTADCLLKLGELSVPISAPNGSASFSDVLASVGAVFGQQVALLNAGPDGYHGAYCPSTLAGLERLAKVGELMNGLPGPGQGAASIPPVKP